MSGDHREPLPVSVIAGYLGAGKTTLINHILREADGRRFAVLVNDFGAINIDADLIVDADDETISLSNGCICCSIGGELYDAIDLILKREDRPDALIIEASGVAEPDRIANIARAEIELALDAKITLVDAVNLRSQLENHLIADSVVAQLTEGDLIAVTKLDLAPFGALQDIEALVRDIAPHARIVAANKSILDIEIVSSVNPGPVALHGHGHKHGHDHVHEDAYARWHYQGDLRLDDTELEIFQAGLPRSLLRLKGYICGREPGTAMLVQHVGQRTEFEKIDGFSGTHTTLVGIGPRRHFEPDDMDALVAKMMA